MFGISTSYFGSSEKATVLLSHLPENQDLKIFFPLSFSLGEVEWIMSAGNQ
jgi:hypothetical protein